MWCWGHHLPFSPFHELHGTPLPTFCPHNTVVCLPPAAKGAAGPGVCCGHFSPSSELVVWVLRKRAGDVGDRWPLPEEPPGSLPPWVAPWSL